MVLCLIATGCAKKATISKANTASKPVYFDFDKSVVKPEFEKQLNDVAHTKQMLSIVGHCDERGSDAYNMELGMKRALAVKDYLVGKGIEENKLQCSSLGERQPVCKEHNEDCWKQNRKAELLGTTVFGQTSWR
jgi:peptidoglycan-associated lipoprotein